MFSESDGVSFSKREDGRVNVNKSKVREHMQIIILGQSHFAKKLADKVPKAVFLEIEEKIFPDGEICPRILMTDEELFRNAHVIIALQLELTQSKNQYLISLLLTIYNVKRFGAAKVTCIMPYHLYSRQDRESRLGEPLSNRYLASMLEDAGIDNFLTINSHSYGKNPLTDFFKKATATTISAIPILAKAVKEQSNATQDILCFSPDEGALMLAEEAANAINSPFFGAIKKIRNLDTGEISQELVGIDIPIENREVLIVDDLVSSGGTMIGAAKIIRYQGAKAVYLAYIHGVYSIENFHNLEKENFQLILTTDTIKSDFPTLTTISVIDLISEWINTNLLT